MDSLMSCPMFNWQIFLVCLAAFCLATFLPYGIGRWRKSANYQKYLARNWFAVVFPAMLALYLVLVDGMDVLQAEVTKWVIGWAMAQGLIFTLSDTAQKVVVSWGQMKLQVETKDKTHDPQKGSAEETSTEH